MRVNERTDVRVAVRTILCAAIALGSASAGAQESLGEIVVTAQRR